MANLTYSQLEGLWEQAGGDPAQAPLMAAIALAESSGNPAANNYTDNNGKQTSWGLWQISNGTHSEPGADPNDPLSNAKMAVAKVASQGLTAWGTYDSGAYRQFMQGGVAPTTGTYSSAAGASDATTTAAESGQSASYGTSGSQAAGGPPPLSDINALDDYIKENFPADSWILSIPDIRTTLESAVAAGDDPGQIQALLQETPWWKTTSQNMQEYDALQATSPAELNFNTPGSQASQHLSDVMKAASTAGVTLSASSAQQFALDIMKYGWDANQLNAAIGATVYYTGTGATAKTDAGALITQLQSAASQYLLAPTDPVIQSYAQNIASGTQTIDQFDAYLKQQASLKWTGMAGQIQQGYTPNQIVDSLRTNAAQTMEVDPSSINFVTDPTYSKILDYVPPNSPNGVHRIMTQSEMDQYLKATPQWGSTQQSRDQVGTLVSSMLQTLGKVGG